MFKWRSLHLIESFNLVVPSRSKITRSKNFDFIVCSAYLYSTCLWQLCPVMFCSHRCGCFILARFSCFGGQARAKKMAEVVGGGFCLPFTFCLLNWAADVCSLEACELSYGWFAWPCAAVWVPGEAAHLWSQPGDGSAAFSDNTRQGHWGDLVSIAGSFFSFFLLIIVYLRFAYERICIDAWWCCLV